MAEKTADVKAGKQEKAEAKPPSEKKTNGDAKKEPAKEPPKPTETVKATETSASTTTVEAREEGTKIDETVKTQETEKVTIETDGSGAFVQVEIGMTLNIENMEFAKIGITRRAPCKAGDAEADAAVKIVKAWCRRELRDEVNGVREKVKAAAEKRKEARKGKK